MMAISSFSWADTSISDCVAPGTIFETCTSTVPNWPLIGELVPPSGRVKAAAATAGSTMSALATVPSDTSAGVFFSFVTTVSKGVPALILASAACAAATSGNTSCSTIRRSCSKRAAF